MSIRLKPRGILVALEGIDGVGKTTQVSLLADRLRYAGLEVVCTKEPTSGKYGRIVRESAKTGRLSPEQELETFLLDRREHVETLIKPSIEAGKVVIVDRYYFSTAAYQGARGMDPDQLLLMNEEFAPRPDLLVVLDTSPAIGLARVASRGDVSNLFEKLEDLEKAAAIFRKLHGPHVFHVDANKSISIVTDTILRKLYFGPLFEVVCAWDRPYMPECQAWYCTVNLAGQCPYPRFGSLAPVAATGQDLLAPEGYVPGAPPAEPPRSENPPAGARRR